MHFFSFDGVQVHGSFRIFFLYAFGVYMGAIMCGCVDVYTSVVGASGGVFCILGLHVANLILNWDELNRALWNRWILFSMLVILLGIEAYVTYTSSSSNVSYAAHAGGFLGGIILGIIFLRNPVLGVREKYFFLPMAYILSAVFVGGGTAWVFTHWPPEFLFQVGHSGQWENPPCCWQVASCSGLSPDDYGLFSCVTTGVDRITSFLVAEGQVYSSCSAMLELAASQKNGGPDVFFGGPFL